MAQNAAAKPPSIKDIACLAHVAHSTVSRALRNSPLIDRRTIERIQRIAQKSGYAELIVRESSAPPRPGGAR
jgi:LacI family transcriptional regulator/LacI family repressor for deo operon, udp, cdd, tsx, nupC, and nupG